MKNPLSIKVLYLYALLPEYKRNSILTVVQFALINDLSIIDLEFSDIKSLFIDWWILMARQLI